MVDVPEHLSGYQARDHAVVDYQMYELSGTALQFRGPSMGLVDGQYGSCLGAAQTFGCFCPLPYPRLLGDTMGVPLLNLGYGGAGPRFFNRHQELIGIVNRGRLAIVQVMSGRSEDNRYFVSGGLEKLTRRSNGREMAADQAWRDVLELRYAWKHLPIGKQVVRKLCRLVARPQLRALVVETRDNWVASYKQLLSSIRVPKILLWISQRTPDYSEDYQSLEGVFGNFPQLVNRQMIDQIAPLASDYVECVTDRGLPQPLVSRFDGSRVTIDLANDRAHFQGRTWTHNAYYPSPEMHEDAVAALQPVVRRWLA